MQMQFTVAKGKEKSERRVPCQNQTQLAALLPTGGVSGLAVVSLSPAVHKKLALASFFLSLFLRNGRSRHVLTPNYSGWFRDRCSVRLGENKKGDFERGREAPGA